MSRVMQWVASLRERVTALLFRERVEADLEEELQFHVEMETDRLVREEGLDPDEARRRAGVSFGGLDRTREEVREASGLGWLTGWWLDVKLGLRMLVRYPALTVLGGLSMAFAIFAGATTFEIASQLFSPGLPLPDADRVAAVQLWDATGGRVERRTLHDLDLWREELTTVSAIGAFRDVDRNLVGSDGSTESVTLAAMDPAGFRVAGVPPLLGRALTESDTRADAPPVVVIGYDVWTDRFAGDSAVIGMRIHLDERLVTVVGVMPEGFGFPIAHRLWIPLDANGRADQPIAGPPVTVFARLAPGASYADVEAELDEISSRIAATHPGHARLRPQVVPWARVWIGSAMGGVNPASLSSILLAVLGLVPNLPLVLFLILVCGNVALLMFARAASRERELIVRSALGASRSRIVVQLFVEALVLVAIAALVGLAAAQYALERLFGIAESSFLDGGSLPFWFHPDLSPSTILYASLLMVLAAAVAGVLPGLKVTRQLQPQLQRVSSGDGGFRFGGIWTAILVAQIAVTMVFPVITMGVRSEGQQELDQPLPFPPEEYLAARLGGEQPLEGETPGDSVGVRIRARSDPTVERLWNRLESDPRVRGVTVTERLPGEYHRWRQVEVDGPMAEPPDERGHRLGSSRVAPNYFEVMGAAVITGRGFTPSDLSRPQRVVVVNESFVERVTGGRSPVGQRVRYLASEEHRDPDQDPGPWHEIVGVVEDIGTTSGYGSAGIHHPAASGEIRGARLVVHVIGDPGSFAPTLRDIAMDVDPTLTLHNLIALDEVTRGSRQFYAFWSALLTTVSGLALILSLCGILAIMSFTVSSRTREIGIRVALGATHLRVIATVLRRPLTQIGLGLVAGAVLLSAMFFGAVQTRLRPDHVFFLLIYVAGMGALCLLACVTPARRALRVEPAEALRIDG